MRYNLSLRQLPLLLLCLLLCAPLLVVLQSVLQPDWQLWQHLTSTVLPDYLQNSLLLAFGVGTGALFIGTTLAWLVVFYRFPLLRCIRNCPC